MSTAPGHTLYTFRNAIKVVFRRGVDNPTELRVYRDGAEVTPTSGTYALYSPAGTNLIINSTPAFIGAAVVTVVAADLPSTLALGPAYREEWALNMPDGEQYKLRRPASVGLFQLFPPMSQDDIVQGEYPDLVVSLGTGGAAKLQALMDGAWNYCIRKIEQHGDWPDIIVDSGDLFDWHRHETLKRAFGAMLQMQNSERWLRLWEEHRDEAKAAKTGLAITVDRDRDGAQDHLGKEPVLQQIHPNVAPTRKGRYDPRWS